LVKVLDQCTYALEAGIVGSRRFSSTSRGPAEGRLEVVEKVLTATIPIDEREDGS
jgi:hypothetical protein